MMTPQKGSLRLLLTAAAVYCACGILEVAGIPYPSGLVEAPEGGLNQDDVRVYLVRTKRYEDQRGASSGYMYKTAHDGPTSYVHFKTSYGPQQQVHPEVEVEPPLPPITKHLAKKHVESDAEAFTDLEGPTHMETTELDDDDDDDDDDTDDEYDDEHGSSYEDASASKHGSKGSSGYSNNEGFAKGGAGKHAVENASGSHSAAGGHKASSHEDAGQYAADHSAGSYEKGGSHSQSASHNKGSKTTGYHKVYRKDEYKKDHSFYDEKNVKGHHDTYGGGHTAHASKEGAFRKGGQHKSGHQEGEQAAKGSYDKGRYDHQDAGYKARDGGEKYHKDAADYTGADGKHSHREWAY